MLIIIYRTPNRLLNTSGPTRCTGVTTDSTPPLCQALKSRPTYTAIAPAKVPGIICSRLVTNKPRAILGFSVTFGGLLSYRGSSEERGTRSKTRYLGLVFLLNPRIRNPNRKVGNIRTRSAHTNLPGRPGNERRTSP